MWREMKATFKTDNSTYAHKISWFTTTQIPYCRLMVTIEFQPEEIAGIKRLGLDKKLLVDHFNILYKQRMTSKDFNSKDLYPTYIKNKYEDKTHQQLIDYFLDGKPRELRYKDLADAQLAIQEIKDALVNIKRHLDAPEPDDTFEI
jgi:hypothetical protein